MERIPIWVLQIEQFLKKTQNLISIFDVGISRILPNQNVTRNGKILLVIWFCQKLSIKKEEARVLDPRSKEEDESD